MFPAALQGNDFDNDGHRDGTYERFYLLTLGAAAQLDAAGIGVLGEFQQYQLRPRQNDGTPLSASVGRVHAVGGYSFHHGEFTVGGGVRVVTLSVDAGASLRGANVLSMSGYAPEIGLLIRPDYAPWRVGVTYRAPVSGQSSSGATPTADDLGFQPPSSVKLPWEIEAGFALQAGPRPLNPRWIDPKQQLRTLRADLDAARAERARAHTAELNAIGDEDDRRRRAEALDAEEARARQQEDERWAQADDALYLERRARYRNWPRPRITVFGEVLATGTSKDAVSLTSLFQGAPVASGSEITWSPRFALEGEPVVDHLQVRTGTYIEPSRYAGLEPRQHFTFGFDVCLGAWSMFGIAGDQIWRLTGLLDVAPLYQNVGLSVGAWH